MVFPAAAVRVVGLSIFPPKINTELDLLLTYHSTALPLRITPPWHNVSIFHSCLLAHPNRGSLCQDTTRIIPISGL